MSKAQINQKIIPHIWFETQAEEAASWYTKIFPNSEFLNKTVLKNTPSSPNGDTTIINLNILGQNFQFINAGVLKDRNPSFSYMVAIKDLEEIKRIWAELSQDAQIFSPLDKYDFSEQYGWLKDKFGVSWQLILHEGADIAQIAPCLLFTEAVYGRAEEAMQFYMSIFKDSEEIPGHIDRFGPNQAPDIEGKLNYARFKLLGQELVFMDSALEHGYAFNEMQSLVIYCKDQAEIDYYFEKLSAVPEAEVCGWLKDKYGVSWQVVPEIMEEIMSSGNENQLAAVTEAFLKMSKFDIKKLEEAYNSAA